MRNFLIFLLTIVPILSVSAQFGFNGVVAHRAGIYNDPLRPENSLAALETAVKLGCYAAEIDVHLTKDRVPIVVHDHEVDGLNVETTDFKDLSHIRLSNGEPIPSLDLFIKTAMKDSRIKLWVDMKRSKVDPVRDIVLADYVADVILNNRAERRVEVITPSFDALIKLKVRLPTIKLLYIGVDKSPEALRFLEIDGVNLSSSRYDGEYSIGNAIEQGLLVGAYVVDDSEKMREMLDRGVHFITTNNPSLLLEVVKGYFGR